MSINKLALEYIGTPIISQAKKKRVSRKSLLSKYEKIRERYVEEKKIVDDIREEGKALQERFDKHNSMMSSYKEEMIAIRKQLDALDDIGSNFVEKDEPEESEPSEYEEIKSEE